MPLVDPSTGLPIGDPTIGANTIGGAVGMDVLGDVGVGYSDAPLAYDLLANMPSVMATMGWNVSRVQQTILRGGSNPGTNARGIRQTFSPRYWRRMGNASNIDPTHWNRIIDEGIRDIKAGSRGSLGRSISTRRVYSPFNFLASAGNFVDRNIGKVPGMSGVASAMASGNSDNFAFSPGTIGRIGVGNKIMNMSAARLSRFDANIASAVREMTPDYNPAGMFRNWDRAFAEGRIGIEELRATRIGAIDSTIGGRVSAKAVGAIRGFEAAGNINITNALRAAADGNIAYGQGLDRGAQFYARMAARNDLVGKAGTFAARQGMISGAARAAGPIGWMLLAHDVAKLGGITAGHMFNGIIAAGKSIQGSITKPVFGVGFKDNQIAATSRARGVMAIQNSRLSARSVLGSEAAAVMSVLG